MLQSWQLPRIFIAMSPHDTQRRLDMGLPLTVEGRNRKRLNKAKLAVFLAILYAASFVLILEYICD